MKSKYMTRGIQERINLTLQIMLWNLYEARKQQLEECDYFHVFQLKKLEDLMMNQEIAYQQEIPSYERVLLIRCEQAITEKIYIIENDEYVMMLLANEY